MMISNKKLLIVFCTVIVVLLNIGYAASESTVNIQGNASSIRLNKLFVSEFYVTDSNGVTLLSLEDINDLNTSTNVNFSSSEYSFITYVVTIANGTDTIQKFNGEVFDSSSDVKNIIGYELTDGLEKGDYLMPGESTTFKLTYKYNNSSNSGDFNLIMSFDFADCGNLSAELFTKDIDLSNIEKAPIKLVVANNSDNSVNYTLFSDNDKFELTDKDGNPLSNFVIAANSKENVDVYLSKKSSVIYYVKNYKTNIALKQDSVSFNFDTVNIVTNITPGYEDTSPPQIGPVTLDIDNTNGTFDVNWTNLDADNAAPVTNYTVLLYNGDGTLIDTVNTNSSDTTYRFTSMAEGNYYAIVYGVDEALNSGESYINESTTDNTNCRRSSITNMQWKFSIKYSLTNISKNGPDTAYRGEKVEIILTANNNYKFTGTPKITDSNGNALNSNEYSITTSGNTGGTISINSINKDIIITASASGTTCLIEGTKVLLRDGSYKNIEDIGYDDLVMVYNHETGNFIGEYPIWIESGKTTDSYQVTTFSDGTTLKTKGSHTVFSADKNQYVDVTNRDEFNIGTRIFKVNKNLDGYYFSIVSVVDIKMKYKNVKYYDVVSTRYYNIVTDDVLTSDGRKSLVNFYGFKDNAIWGDRRQEAINNNTFLDYDKDMNFVPYYLYHGLRAQDGAVIIKYNYMTGREFMNVFTDLLLNPMMILPPLSDTEGNRFWMVTTSDDNVIDKKIICIKRGATIF